MPVQTPQRLAEIALRKLGVLPNGQTAGAADVSLVIDKIDGLLADLSVQGIVFVTDPISIPEGAFEHIGALLAERCTDEFMIGGERLSSLQVTAARSLNRLRAYSAAPTKFDATDFPDY